MPLIREESQTCSLCKRASILLPRYLHYCFLQKGLGGVCRFSPAHRFCAVHATHTQAHRLSKIITPRKATSHLFSRSPRLHLLCSSHTAAIITQQQHTSNKAGKPRLMPLLSLSPTRHQHFLPKSSLKSVIQYSIARMRSTSRDLKPT